MSHPSPRDAHVLDDAEKGVADVVLANEALTLPSHVMTAPGLHASPSTHSDVSTAVGTPSEKPSPGTSEEAVVASAPSTAQPSAKRPSPPRAPAWIRFRLWFNTYRKFFTFIVTLNLVGVVLAASGHWQYAVDHIAALVLGNLLFAILMRNELFGRLRAPAACLTRLTVGAPQIPSGVHLRTAASGRHSLWMRVVRRLLVDLQGCRDLAVIVSVMSAFPWVRNTHHNTFERYHRFVGWLGLAATWIFVILGDTYNPETRRWDPSGKRLLTAQEFWFVIGMTVFILLPWLFVREVAVDVEIPSPKVAILRFERGMQQGLLLRAPYLLSAHGVPHRFGIISEGTHAKYHYMICGVQGDFTRGLVNDPPKRIWTRELKFAGVSNTSTLYKRGIRVCTGTGIGAALSTCIQNRNWFLIWIGSDQEKTFGPTISGLIHSNIEPERMILWDSKKEGRRPDTMQLVRDTYKSYNEVVFITSNWQGNQEIMEGCKVSQIPAFGTLWDF